MQRFASKQRNLAGKACRGIEAGRHDCLDFRGNVEPSHLWRTIVLTGVDIIVILFAIIVIVYTASPSNQESEMKLQPLTLLIVAIVLAMMIVSIT
jgi:hypothetical protein